MSDQLAGTEPVEAATVPQREHVGYFDWLRVIAILAVVVLHTAAINWYTTPVSTFDWHVLNLIDSAVRFSVPVFFMVSGAIFLTPDRGVTVRSILTKSLPRIMVPFAVWSVLYAVLSEFGPGGGRSVGNLVANVVLGHYHLWFLIALSGLYLATPILRPLVRDRALSWYFVTLGLIFSTVVPLLQFLPFVGELVQRFTATMQLNAVLGYTVYFVLGYLLHTAVITTRTVLLAGAAGAAGLIATAVGTALLSDRANQPVGVLYDYLTPNVVVVAVAVFLLVKRLSPPTVRVPRAVVSISGWSFGIYLVHPFFQNVLTWTGVTALPVPSIVLVPLLAIAMVVPSIVVTVLIRRIPRVGTWIT